VEPVTSPVERVDTAVAQRTVPADAVVVAAWTDHHAELFAFLVRTTRSPDVAEDLLQEAFLRLTREARADRVPDNIRAWLYRVSGNLAVSRGRRLAAALRGLTRIGSSPTAVAGAARPADAPEAEYLREESRAALLRALDDLGPASRTALLLASEGFTGAEIAAAIGRSEAATRTLLCRARLRARSRLESAEAVS
jgi:RNA polymerase sigma-70 factor (ECF subfamily)